MKNIKVCSFVANYTHSCIVANNFISKEFSNAKATYAPMCKIRTAFPVKIAHKRKSGRHTNYG